MTATDQQRADLFKDPALAGRRTLATIYLVLIYGLVTPALGGLLVWGLDRALAPHPRPLFDFSAEPGFWLMIAFVLGAPVLLVAAVVHFLVRRKAALPAFGIVASVSALLWMMLGLVIEARRVPPVIAVGLVAVAIAFPVARWAYNRAAFGALPAGSESAKPLT